PAEMTVEHEHHVVEEMRLEGIDRTVELAAVLGRLLARGLDEFAVRFDVTVYLLTAVVDGLLRVLLPAQHGAAFLHFCGSISPAISASGLSMSARPFASSWRAASASFW